MKKITFKCRNRDSEILGIVICVLLFLAGWLISSAIARNYGGNVLVTAGIPVAFLVCGVVFLSRRKNTAGDGTGTAEFADSGKVRLTFGGRSVIFDCRDVRNVSYVRDSLATDAAGCGYLMTIRLPLRSLRLFSEELPQNGGFEDTDLYAVYRELCGRMKEHGRTV